MGERNDPIEKERKEEKQKRERTKLLINSSSVIIITIRLHKMSEDNYWTTEEWDKKWKKSKYIKVGI